MSPQHRCLMIGAGGMAGHWIRAFLPAFAARCRIVGLVDMRPEVLAESGDFLGLPADHRFATTGAALDQVAADFAIVVIPPAFHLEVVEACLAAGLDVLCEKPIADTWPRCLALAAAQRQTGRKVQIIQNYRYTERILTFQEQLTRGRLGRLNYLVARFAADYRRRGAWGQFRHEIPHALLVEGAVHHFDQLRNLAGADCLRLAGWDWNPAWSSFDGESSGVFVMHFAGGVRGLYEGNCNEAGWQTSWHREQYRAECEGGAVVLDQDGQVRLLEHTGGGRHTLTDVPAVTPRWPQGHQVQIEQFLDWLDDGPAPETVLADNLQTAAMLFAAVEASETGQAVDVAAKAAEAAGP